MGKGPDKVGLCFGCQQLMFTLHRQKSLALLCYEKKKKSEFDNYELK